MTRKKPKSLTPEILRLSAQGLSQYAIAKKLDCTEANVWKAITRERKRLGLYTPRKPRPWAGTIAPLSPAQTKWLEEEAARIGTTPDIIARSFIVDGIADEIEKAAARATASSRIAPGELRATNEPTS